MSRRIWGYFVTGETKRIDVLPRPDRRFLSNIENAYLLKDGSLATRGGFLLSGLVPKISSYHASYIYQYAFNRVAIFQFGAFISGSQLAREVRYSIIDTDIGVVKVENERLTVVSGYYFDHFQVISRRKSANDETSINYYATGAERLHRLVFSDTGIVVTALNASHPYAPSTFGDFLVFVAERTSNDPISSVFSDTKAFGTILILFDIKKTTNAFTTFNFAINAHERITQTTYFAESLFWLTNQGLRQVNFNSEFVATQTGAVQRQVARFAGRNVPLQQLHGNFLLYAANELRVRDVSSLQAGIAVAGDYIASPYSNSFVANNSAYFAFEDIVLFVLEDKKSIKALTSYISAESRGGVHSFTTFIKFEDRLIEGISSSLFPMNQKNTFLLTDSDDDNLELLYYNPVSSADYGGGNVVVFIKTSFFAQVNSVTRMEVHVDLGDAEFTALPTNMCFYEDTDKGIAIVAQDVGTTGRRYGGGLEVSFATNLPVKLKFFMMIVSEVEE